MDLNQLQMTQEDATKLFIGWLRNPQYNSHTRYGYDIYLPSLIRVYLEQKRVDHFEIDKHLDVMGFMLIWPAVQCAVLLLNLFCLLQRLAKQKMSQVF